MSVVLDVRTIFEHLRNNKMFESIVTTKKNEKSICHGTFAPKNCKPLSTRTLSDSLLFFASQIANFQIVEVEFGAERCDSSY